MNYKPFRQSPVRCQTGLTACLLQAGPLMEISTKNNIQVFGRVIFQVGNYLIPDSFGDFLAPLGLGS